MKNKLFFLSVTVLLNLNVLFINADPAWSDSLYVIQPDGSILWLVERGDEYYSWVETTDGTILDSKKVLINNN